MYGLIRKDTLCNFGIRFCGRAILFDRIRMNADRASCDGGTRDIWIPKASRIPQFGIAGEKIWYFKEFVEDPRWIHGFASTVVTYDQSFQFFGKHVFDEVLGSSQPVRISRLWSWMFLFSGSRNVEADHEVEKEKDDSCQCPSRIPKRIIPTQCAGKTSSSGSQSPSRCNSNAIYRGSDIAATLLAARQRKSTRSRWSVIEASPARLFPEGHKTVWRLWI